MDYALIVDDDRGSCLVLTKMLSSLGFVCDTENNVGNALRAFVSKKYRLVLVDCLLPDHSGWVGAQAIKQLSKNGQLPLIIGILSFPDEQMMRRCESSGMHGVLAKPITKATLSDCIQRLMVSESCTSGSSSICWKADMQLRSGVFPSTAGVISEQQVRSCSARTEQTSKDEPLERASSAPLQLSPFNIQEADPLGLGDLNTT